MIGNLSETGGAEERGGDADLIRRLDRLAQAPARADAQHGA